MRLALALLLGLGAPAGALESGSTFLNIGTGARPEALGGAYTAMAGDVHALHYNPAGLAGVARPEAAATHARWPLGASFDFIGYGHPTGLGTFGFSLSRLASGEVQGRGADRRAAASYEAVDSAYTLGIGRSAGELLPGGRARAGASVKWIERRIGTASGSGLAADLGVAQELSGRPLTLGASVLNLGQGIRFLDQTDPLPTLAAVGLSWRMAGVATLSADLRREIASGRAEVAVGTEYSLLQGMAVRAGYTTAALGATPLGGLGGGVGLKLGRYRADYAFTPFAFGNVQRLSLGARF